MARTRSLNNVVDISVYISPLAAPRATFNELLIIGTAAEAIIGTTERLRVYEEADALLDDGFVDTDPEYIAALIYFSQSPAPRRLWIGVKASIESYLEAITACRLAGNDWYYGVCLDAVTADHKAIAAWCEAAVPSTIYAYTTQDADVLQATPSPDDICTYLKKLEYSRTFGQYATNQGGSPIAYPDNVYAIVGVIGYACGQNTGLANSAFTLKFKQEVGIAVEPLTATEITNVLAKNCNLYLNYGNYYNWFGEGKMADGTFIDEKINLDMLVNNIQLSVCDLLNSTAKVPQTEVGTTEIINEINKACEKAVTVGFLAPGTWTGIDILNLKNGDTLPRGYLVQAEALADQSRADREARKSPSMYVAIKEAGAVHSVLIGVYVNR